MTNFGRLRTIDPVFYQQVIDVFPEMLAHERYFHDLDMKGAAQRYARDEASLQHWIDTFLVDPSQRALATKRLKDVLVRRGNSPHRYPLPYLLRQLQTGAYKRVIQPDPETTPTRRRRKLR